MTDASENAGGGGNYMPQAGEDPRTKGVVGENLMGDPEDLTWSAKEDGLIGVQTIQANRVNGYLLGFTPEDAG